VISTPATLKTRSKISSVPEGPTRQKAPARIPGSGELAGDLKTDAGGRAGDEGGFVAQVQIHGGVSFYALRHWALPELLAVADFGRT
jgi:hypothetical protein